MSPVRDGMVAGVRWGALHAAVVLSCVGCSLSHESAPDAGGTGRADTGVPVVDPEPADDAGRFASTDGRYLGVIAGDDINGTFSLTITQATLSGLATLEAGGTQQSHAIELSSGDPSSGRFQVQIGDLHGEATISGDGLGVELQASDSGASVARADGTRTEDEGSFFCGTYSGGDNGRWNFVITAEGDLAGSFWSSLAEGTLDGVVDGSSVSLDWQGSGGLPTEVSGQATGTITADSTEGTWSGSGFSGTWMSTQTCPGG